MGEMFGDRAAKATVTGAAAKAVFVATNTWWLGLTVGVGSRWLASYGGNKRQRYEALERVVESLKRAGDPISKLPIKTIQTLRLI